VDKIKEGDIVGRISYGCDVYFKVISIIVDSDGKKYAVLRGIDIRLLATSPLNDLRKINLTQVAAFWHNLMTENHEKMKRIFQRREQEQTLRLSRAIGLKNNKIESFDVPGSVLHIDGDGDYLDLCLTTYRQLGITAHGVRILEEKQPERIGDLLEARRPDILVLTGHDGLVKGVHDFTDLNNYHTSKYFIEAIKVARQYEKSKDDLIIFAGACQSHYEALLKAGANFASSPQRVLIHAFDPVFIVEKIAYTSIYDAISLKDIIGGTITGFAGVGGLETRGKYRLGIPKSPY